MKPRVGEFWAVSLNWPEGVKMVVKVLKVDENAAHDENSVTGEPVSGEDLDAMTGREPMSLLASELTHRIYSRRLAYGIKE